MASSVPLSDSVLVVEAAIHAANKRFAPTPSLEPFAASLGGSATAKALEPQGFWFRAEVSPAGRVDQVSLLTSSPSLPQGSVEAALRANLRLRYVDDRRHRNVVYGRAAVTAEGVLKVENGLVSSTMCCSFCCWVPEFEDYVCPCPF